MTLRNVLPWIHDAYQEGSAIGAFNANTMEQMQAIVSAAQAENAPVIIQISHNAALYIGDGDEKLGLRYMAAIGKIAASSVDVPVSLHLDHAGEEAILEAIALGFNSVMFAGAHLPFDLNVAKTEMLAAICRDAAVCLEGEVGEVPKPGGGNIELAPTSFTQPEEAATFVQTTGVDLLAVDIGSVHGHQRKHMKLDIKRLGKIREKVDIPLVLHGSSGVLDEDVAQGIRHGLSKVNVATQLNKAFTGAVRAVLDSNEQLVDPRQYLASGRQAQVEAVRERIRFFGAVGKAKRY